MSTVMPPTVANLPDGELPGTFVEGFHDAAVVREMQYRTLMHYGMVSVISLGGSGLGGMYEEGKGSGLTDATDVPSDDRSVWWQNDSDKEKERACEVVTAALKAGINLIDTAHWYGQGRSERLLGHALKSVPRRAFFVNTKVGRYEKDPKKMFDFSYQRIYQSVLDSLKRLQLEYIDCVQLHDPEFADSVDIIVKEALPALDQARREGKIKRIGLTGYPLELQRRIICESQVRVDTSLAYCHMSLCDTSLTSCGHVDFCREKNIGLISAAPLSMGLLTSKGPPNWHPASSETKDLCALAANHCESVGVDIAKIALHFALSDMTIATTLISCDTTSLLEANLVVARRHFQLSKEEQAALTHLRENIFVPAGDQSWEGIEVAAYRKIILS